VLKTLVDKHQIFLPYDEDIEPLATEDKSAVSAWQVAEDECQEREFKVHLLHNYRPASY
jgi:hypothetical protein